MKGDIFSQMNQSRSALRGELTEARAAFCKKWPASTIAALDKLSTIFHYLCFCGLILFLLLMEFCPPQIVLFTLFMAEFFMSLEKVTFLWDIYPNTLLAIMCLVSMVTILLAGESVIEEPFFSVLIFTQAIAFIMLITRPSMPVEA